MSTKILRSGAFIYTVGHTEAGQITSIQFIDPTQKGVELSLHYDEVGNPRTLTEKRVKGDAESQTETHTLIFKLGADCTPLEVTTQITHTPDPMLATADFHGSPVDTRAPENGEATHVEALLARFANIHAWAATRIP
ncbi:MAG: hypothetical protein J0L97_07755 [Alphaproteobacteria bacterium]|nr:hypothetical protein [Alphaproteobacteria bacterium]